MTHLPHDAADLYLAPVALSLEARIRELGSLDVDQLTTDVALEADSPDWTRDMREQALLRAIAYLTDCHGWDLSWDPRGLRVSHGANSLVLGVPAVFTAYLDGAGTAQR